MRILCLFDLADLLSGGLLIVSTVVPCEPKEACLGENICRSGYKSKAPMFRCSSCEDCTDENGESISDCKRHFRRAGLCVPCPGTLT